MMRDNVLIAIFQKLYNEKKVIDTKHSLGRANLSSSIITPEGQSILSLMIL